MSNQSEPSSDGRADPPHRGDGARRDDDATLKPPIAAHPTGQAQVDKNAENEPAG